MLGMGKRANQSHPDEGLLDLCILFGPLAKISSFAVDFFHTGWDVNMYVQLKVMI